MERKRDRRKKRPERDGEQGSEKRQDEYQVNGKHRMWSGGMIRKKERYKGKTGMQQKEWRYLLSTRCYG